MRYIYDKFQFYVKALVWFLIFITIFLAAFSYVYLQTTKRLKTDAVNRTLTEMQNGANEVNNNFLRFYNTFPTIIQMDETQTLARGGQDGLQPSEYSQLIKLKKQLTEIWTFNTYISDIMLVFDTADSFAISPLYTLDDFRSSYENKVFYCADYTYDEFMTLVRDNANSTVTINKFMPALRFASNFPTESSTPQGSEIMFSYRLGIPYRNYNVYAIMFLDTDGMRNMLLGSSGGKSFAVTNGSTILESSGLSPAAKSTMANLIQESSYDQATRNTYLRVTAGSLALAFQTAINDHDIIRQIGSFSALLKLLLVVFVIISSLVLILTAVYILKPLQNLFNRFYDSYIKAPRMRGKVFDHIGHEIDLISSDNVQINTKLSNWEPMVRGNLLRRLLRGEALNNEEQNLILQFLNLNLNNSQDVWLVAVIGEIDSPAATDAGCSRPDISQAVWSVLPEAMICRLHSRYLAVVSHGQSAGDELFPVPWNCETLYRRILAALNQDSSSSFAIGIGTSRRELFEIHQSFKEAERAFREADIWKHPDVVLYQTLRQDSFSYRLPYQDIEKLYNMLASGDASQAGTLLDSIAGRVFQANNQNRQYDVICKQFYFEIFGVLLRISAQKGLAPILNTCQDYDENVSLAETVQRFQQAFELIAEAIRSSSNHISPHVLFLDIQNFILSNFNNNDLSLKLLSQVFSLSEPYLSICFKNESGLNFSSFLENLRLTEAENLLLEARLAVKDIARKVGYSSPNTFFKAFKRKHGITPSDWVEVQQARPIRQEG